MNNSLQKKTLISPGGQSIDISQQIADIKNMMKDHDSDQTKLSMECYNGIHELLLSMSDTIAGTKKEVREIRHMLSLAEDNERLRAISVGIAFSLLITAVLFSTLSHRTAITISFACAFLCACFAFFRR